VTFNENTINILNACGIIIINARFIAKEDEKIYFTISAPELNDIDPPLVNFQVPLFIQSDKDISNAIIEEIKFTLNRNVFYPKSMSQTQGTMNSIINQDMREYTLRNIVVPPLTEGVKTELCFIRGDVLLGDIDYSPIILQDVTFVEKSHIPLLLNGYISFNIYREGGNRLRDVKDVSPSVDVEINPAQHLLQVICICIEKGDHSLQIVDLLGNTTTIKK